jgi:hypothetical protein
VLSAPTSPVTLVLNDPAGVVKSIVPVTGAQIGPQVPVGAPYGTAWSVPL